MNLPWYGTLSKRLLWTVAGAVWLAIISLPALGLLLAVRGELSWHPGDYGEYRVWVVTEENVRGLGWQARHVVSHGVQDTCLQTTWASGYGKASRVAQPFASVTAAIRV